jgi:hypothetical protein
MGAGLSFGFWVLLPAVMLDVDWATYRGRKGEESQRSCNVAHAARSRKSGYRLFIYLFISEREKSIGAASRINKMEKINQYNLVTTGKINKTTCPAKP